MFLNINTKNVYIDLVNEQYNSLYGILQVICAFYIHMCQCSSCKKKEVLRKALKKYTQSWMDEQEAKPGNWIWRWKW